MAKLLSSEGDELPRCSTLFLKEDGSQMSFYMTPCAMKRRLRPLIHHGGGQLTSKVLTDSIKLATPGTGKNLSSYISSDYIFDSIKHNKLQDLEKYSMKPLDTSETSVTSSKSNGKSSASNSSSSTKRERHRYTIDEDLALIKFVKTHFACYRIKGNILYQKAEKAKITSHPWQSMRDHYLKVLHKQNKHKEYADLSIKSRTLKSSVEAKKKTKREETEKTSTTVDKDQERVTKSQTSKGKENIENSSETDDQYNFDDTSEDTDQERISRVKTSRLKAKNEDKDKHVVTDHSNYTNADYLSGETIADNADDEQSAAEEVDYDKIFDDNLLKQAYEYKKRDSNELQNDAIEDKDVDEESRVSSSQELVNKVVTRSRQKVMNEQEGLSDFDGEIVFRKDLKSPSAKKANVEESEDDKKPIAKRSKRDMESLSDDENPSEKQRTHQKAFLKYCQALHNLQKLGAEFTVPQVVHALLVCSGFLDDAEDYVQNGTGKEQWTSEEDKILLSKNKDDISSLAKKRGLHSVIDRMNFMEGIN